MISHNHRQPKSRQTHQTFDDAGRMVSSQDWLGHTTTFQPDADSNLQQTLFDNVHGGTQTDTYSYDHADRLTGSALAKPGTTWFNETYARDAVGQPTRNDYAGSSLVIAHYDYGYNNLNQITTGTGGVTQWTYDPANNLTKLLGLKQAFDPAGELCYSSPTSAADADCATTTPTPPSDATTYSYDNRGNRTGIDQAVGLPSTFGYDQANRLTSATVPTLQHAQGQYTPVASQRVLDTQSATHTNNCFSSDGSCTTIPAGGTLLVNLSGAGGLPSSGMGAAALSLTVLPVSGSGDGYATVYGLSDNQPSIRSISYKSGERTGNDLITKVGADSQYGWIAIYSSQQTDVLLDTEGWFASSTGADGSSFTAVPPTKLMDTRSATRTSSCPTSSDPCTTLAANGTPLNVQATGLAGIPSNATAIAVQITTWGPAFSGRLIAFASGDATPSTRTVTMTAGLTQTTGAEVKLGTGAQAGRFTLVSNQAVDVTVDVVGYYKSADTNSGESVYVPTTASVLYNASVSATTTTNVAVGGHAGVPANYTAVVADITTSGSTQAGQLWAYPTNASGVRPDRTLSIDPTRAVTEQVVIPAGDNGQLSLYAGKQTNVEIDVVGYYQPDTATLAYGYNGDGLRTSKTINGATTNFAWAKDGSLPQLLTEATGSGTTYYLYDPTGVPYEQINPDGTTYWLHHGLNSNIELVTNTSGTVVAWYFYDTYGKRSASTSYLDSFGYAGQYTDNETGLQYLRARYYDPGTGQFLNRDPAIATTRDVYGYADRSPLNASDPSGLMSADSAEHYISTGGYVPVTGMSCEGGFGVRVVDDSSWQNLSPKDRARYAYTHVDDLKREGQLPETTGDRLVPSVWDSTMDMIADAVGVGQCVVGQIVWPPSAAGAEIAAAGDAGLMAGYAFGSEGVAGGAGAVAAGVGVVSTAGAVILAGAGGYLIYQACS